LANGDATTAEGSLMAKRGLRLALERQDVYNLIEMGLAWDPEIQTKPEFFELSTQLKRQFNTL
jgi:hypothetical protein